jgi:small neutral amino acid transporter SnatA (MarC family)
MEPVPQRPLGRSSDAKRRWRQQLMYFLIFLVFSALGNYVLFFNPPRSAPNYWVVVIGNVICSAMTVIAFVSLVENWTQEQEDRTVIRTSAYILVAVVIIVLVLIYLGNLQKGEVFSLIWRMLSM